MSLPCFCVADVITTRLMLLPMIFILADVIAIIVVDVITTVLNVLEHTSHSMGNSMSKWRGLLWALPSAQ